MVVYLIMTKLSIKMKNTITTNFKIVILETFLSMILEGDEESENCEKQIMKGQNF